MKNILIIADGKIAKTFLQRVYQTQGSKSKYHVVYYDEDMLPENKKENTIFYKFDPTSFSKLSGLLRQIEFYEVFVVLANRQDCTETLNNIRKHDSELKVVLLDLWGLDIDDKNIKLIETSDIVANRIINFLPNIPVFAKEIGLGQGEIMEMEIPPTSSYAYKHIGSLEQSRWKIVALYRKQTLHLPQQNMMLLPNDIIVAVGNPAVLQSVYRSINQDYGQFPEPFGSNLYCFIDMQLLSDKEIENLTNDCFILHSKLNNKKLIIRVINPVLSKCYDKLKSYKNANISVLFEYECSDVENILKEDMKKYDVGLVIVDNKSFLPKRDIYYRLKLPIFKVAKSGFFNIKKSVVLSSDSVSVESISSVVFDLSSQLNLDITLFSFQEQDKDESSKIEEHFNSLAKLFDQKVDVKKIEQNPILYLEEKSDYIQFIRFNERVCESNFLDKLISTNLEDHFLKLSSSYQLYIPTL